MPNVMATLLDTDGALCESSVIPFLVPHRKLWLIPTAQVPCSNDANIRDRKTWRRSEFYSCQNSVRKARAPENVYIVYQRRRWPNIVQSLVDVC